MTFATARALPSSSVIIITILTCIYLLFHILFYTTLHAMQTRSSHENSVHPSVLLYVRLSVKRVDCNKMEERFVQIFIPYERTFSLVLWEEEWLMGATPSTWNFGSIGPHWSEIADFEKSSINTNRKSTMRFPMSQIWSSYVAPKPWGLKNAKTAVLHPKSHFVGRKSATKFLCVQTVSDKVAWHWLA